MEHSRIYAMIFALLTFIKLAAPGVAPALKSSLPNLYFKEETLEKVETLGRSLAENGREDAVRAMLFGDYR